MRADDTAIKVQINGREKMKIIIIYYYYYTISTTRDSDSRDCRRESIYMYVQTRGEKRLAKQTIIVFAHCVRMAGECDENDMRWLWRRLTDNNGRLLCLRTLKCIHLTLNSDPNLYYHTRRSCKGALAEGHFNYFLYLHAK